MFGQEFFSFLTSHSGWLCVRVWPVHHPSGLFCFPGELAWPDPPNRNNWNPSGCGMLEASLNRRRCFVRVITQIRASGLSNGTDRSCVNHSRCSPHTKMMLDQLMLSSLWFHKIRRHSQYVIFLTFEKKMDNNLARKTARFVGRNRRRLSLYALTFSILRMPAWLVTQCEAVLLCELRTRLP